jgi:hypothetical protein
MVGRHVEVTPMEPRRFGVQVTEGQVTTSHRVFVPPTLVEDLGLDEADATRLVEASFEFLLEREPNTAILRDFALDDIARFFPDYFDEVRTRLGRPST